jgi:hypothetical protein
MGKEELEERKATMKRLKELSEKAEAGDAEAVPEIRQILTHSPDLIFKFVNLAGQTEEKLLDHLTDEGDLASREFMHQELSAMRAEIAGEEPSPLERLLAERVVVTWLEVQHFQGLYSHNMRQLTIYQHEFHQKRLDKAHRRHLSAIKTLAQVRKLLKGKDITQINIAEQQMNFASGSEGSG